MLVSPFWQMGYATVLMKVSCWLLLSVFYCFAPFPQSQLHVMQCSLWDAYYQTVAEKELNTLKICGPCVWLEFPPWKALCICIDGMTGKSTVYPLHASMQTTAYTLLRKRGKLYSYLDIMFPTSTVTCISNSFLYITTLEVYHQTHREEEVVDLNWESGGRLRILEVPICLCPTPISLLCRICSELTCLFPTVDQPSDECCWPWLEWNDYLAFNCGR